MSYYSSLIYTLKCGLKAIAVLFSIMSLSACIGTTDPEDGSEEGEGGISTPVESPSPEPVSEPPVIAETPAPTSTATPVPEESATPAPPTETPAPIIVNPTPEPIIETPEPVASPTPTPVIETPAPTPVPTPEPTPEPIVETPEPIATPTPSNLENLSLGKPSIQSSIDNSGSASRAVDGNTSGVWTEGSVTHTLDAAGSWWQVDLGTVSNIDHVKIWNRTDTCCQERLSNFYLLISNTPFESNDLDELLASEDVGQWYNGPVAGSPTEIGIETTGRYVRVQLVDANPLSIAELQVMGTIDMSSSNGVINSETDFVSMPAILEAEDFINYMDSDEINTGGQYRENDGVDIQVCDDDDCGFNVGWTEAGEWLEYAITVNSDEAQQAEFRVASPVNDASLSLALNGVNLSNEHSVANTGGTQVWATETVSLGQLEQGEYILRLTVETGGFNLNWINVNAESEEPNEPTEPENPELPEGNFHPDIVRVLDADIDDIPRNPGGDGWKDSYSVGDQCYCETTFDHNIGGIEVDTAIGTLTVREACELVGPGPGSSGRPIYNDIQCGNGPANDAGDEDYCPGRVDIGKEGCIQIGPTWKF